MIFKEVSNYKDLPPRLINQIERFFESYKLLEGKTTKILGWEDEISVRNYIKKSHQAYLDKH